MRKKNSKLAFLFCLPIVAFLTLAIFLVSGISSGFVLALSGNGGGFFVRSNSKLEISGGTTISGNSATNGGGGVYVEEGGTLTMNGSSLVRVDSSGNVDSNGDYILFGSYPKTYQSDTSVITSTQDENGYYLGTDGNRYAKVSANPNEYITSIFNDGTTIVSGAEYYFKVEPIKWRILKTENGKALLLCEDIIDAHHFYSSTSSRTINGSTIYANNYKYSDIRAWLNGYSYQAGNTEGENWLNNGFLQTAFTTAEQNSILTTTVDNSASTTNSSSNTYACENTNDKIFLLSYQDIINTEYGFSSSNSEYDTARRKQTTDYARANYAYYSTISTYLYNGFYWLRSPASYDSNFANYVGDTGNSGYSDGVSRSLYGVVPALYVSASELQSCLIFGNSAISGNGNDIYNAGTFTMTGGIVGSSENEQTGFGIYNTGTMNLFGGTIHDSIYSETSFNTKIGATINGTITLCDSATINVLDYAGTTPEYNIIISDSRVSGTILTLQGNSTQPDLEKINISGFDESRYEIVSSQDETTGFWIVVLKEIIVRYDKDGNEDPEGKYVFFGSYPKTIKASDVTVDETDVDTNGYFLGSDGERYAKVTNFSRPGNFFGLAFDDPDAHYVFSDGTAMTEGGSYYFKVEPLKWKILSEEDGELLIVCDEIVDAHCYYHSLSYRYFNERHTEPNSYYYSDIRSWLNGYAPIVPDKEDDELGEDWSSGGFLQSAFSDKEQSFIAVTEILYNSVTYAKASDKIFLLEYSDLISSSYGYSSASTYDDERKMKTTDFSKANGVFFVNYGDNSDSYGCYWTGSPCREYDNYGNSSYSYGSHVVDFYGNLTKEYGGNYWRVDRTDIGVVPALTINLNRKKLSCGHFLKSSTSEYVDVLDENGESIGHQLVTKKFCSECENIDVEYGEVESHYLTLNLKTSVSDDDDTCHQEGTQSCHTCGFSGDYVGKSIAHNYETTSTSTVSDGSSGHHTETKKKCSRCLHLATITSSTVSHSLSTTSTSTVSDGSSGHHTVTKKKCSSCSYSTTITGSTVSHSLSTTSTSTVSDGSSGHHTVTNKKCSSCSYTTTITGSTVSHSLSTTSTNTVSDGSSGHHTETNKKCSKCSYTTTITGSTTDHSLSTTYSYLQLDNTYHNRITTKKCSDCSYSTTSTKKMMHALGTDEVCSCGYSPNLAFSSTINSLEIVDEDVFYDDKKKKMGESLFFDDKKLKGNFIFQLPRIGT